MLELPPIEPDDQVHRYEYEIELGGATYSIRLTWRDRTESWYLDLTAADGTQLLTGRRLSINWPANWRHVGPLWPEGWIALVSTDDTDVECGFEDLGWRCRLVYLEPEDLPEETSRGVTWTIEVAT